MGKCSRITLSFLLLGSVVAADTSVFTSVSTSVFTSAAADKEVREAGSHVPAQVNAEME